MSDEHGQPDLSALYTEFLDESRELLDGLARDLVDLERRAGDPEVVHRVFRAAHSLKGNAGFIGMEVLATVAHAMENVLAAVRSESLAPSPELLDLLLRALDACRRLLAAGPGAETGVDVEELMQRLGACLRPASQESPGPARTPDGPLEPPTAAASSGERPDGAAGPSQEGPDRVRPHAGGSEVLSPIGVAPTASATVRVSTPRLDRLVNLAGELMATRSRLAALARALGDRRLEDVASSVSRLADQLQAEVLSIRMVPIRTLFQRCHRLVRDTARELGRAVRLELAGETTELDKAIIEALHDPLVHLVRNAIGHGIEPPDARGAAGKRPEGVLRLAARHAQDHVVVEVTDDGRGIDEAAVRRRAAEAGLIGAEEAAAPLTADSMRRLVFAPGFSTATSVDRVAGRGVGLDVVRTAVEGLGGSVELSTRPREGTTFTIRAPLTLAMIQIFIVRVAGRLYGLPLPHVDETLRAAPARLEVVASQPVLLLRGQPVQVIPLADVLAGLEGAGGALGSRPAGEALQPLVIVRHGARRVGLLVDEVCGKEKTVLKPLGPFVAHLPRPPRGIAGASLLGTGDLVLVADVAALVGQVAETVPA